MAGVGVDPMSLSFGDLRAITGATVTIDRGLDPLAFQCRRSVGRRGYPRIWSNTAHALRLTPETTDAGGLVLFAAFIASLALLAPVVTTKSDAVLMDLCCVTPAAMLAVEPGKIDFIVLLLVCSAVASGRAPWLRQGLLTAATMLKLFPVFAIPGLRRPTGARGYPGLHCLLSFWCGPISVETICVSSSARFKWTHRRPTACPA